MAAASNHLTPRAKLQRTLRASGAVAAGLAVVAGTTFGAGAFAAPVQNSASVQSQAVFMPMVKPANLLPDFPADYTTIDDPIDSNDDDHITSGNETNPGQWVGGSGQIGSNAMDLGDTFIGSVTGDQQADLYLGVNIVEAKPATVRIELNKLPSITNSTGVPVPQRTEGDLRLSIDYKNKGAERVYLHEWDGTNWVLVPTIPGTITWVQNADGTYYEFKFDLYKLLGGDSGFDCEDLAFSSAMVRTQASASENSALKDYAAGTVDFNFCGGLQIVKKNEDGEYVGPASFRITPNPLPTGEGDFLDITDNDDNDADKTIGIISLPKVNAGEYTVEETQAPEGYLLPAQREHDPLTVKIGETATFNFVDPLQWKAPTVSKTAEASYNAEYGWSIEKDANETKFDIKDGDKAEVEYTIVVAEGAEERSEYTLDGEITVNNPNAKDMIVTLSDELEDGTACTVSAEDADAETDGLQVSLAAGKNTYPYSCEITAEKAEGKNIVTIEWDNATYPAEQKHVDEPAEAGVSTAEGTKEYAAEIAETTHKTLDVYDQFTFEDGGRKLNEEPLTWTKEGNQHTFTYKRDFVGTPGECTSYENTAKVVDESTVITEDNEIVEVCVSKGPESAKGATGTFVRDFDWKVNKSVVEESYTVNAGDQVNPDYTVVAEVEKVTDSDIKVVGEIQVTNPNNYGEMTATVTDQLIAGEEALEGAVCKVEGEDSYQVTVAAGETKNATYECVLEELPEGDIENNATVSWANGQDSVAVAPVSFEGTYVDAKVVVTDDKTVEGKTNELGAVEVNTETGEIEGENTFTYNDVALTAPAADSCEDFTNTAVVTENTNQDENNTDTAKVEVCANPEEVVPTTTPEPEPTVEETVEPTPEPEKPLAQTGAQVAGIAIGGALLIGAGLAALVWSRRRALEN